MYPLRQTGAGRQVQHIAVSQQLFRPHLIENGARIHPRRHLKSDTSRDIGLDQSGDHIDRRPLSGKNQMNSGSTRLLRQAGDQFLDLLADDHHHVGQLVDHHHDKRQRLQYRVFRRIFRKGIGQPLPFLQRIQHLAIETSDVAHLQCRH